MLDVIALSASKKYTDDTISGMGVIKGKNCQILSIEPIDGGNRVTFAYYDNDDVIQTSSMDVINGADGIDGVDGNDGLTPEIDSVTNHWFIGGIDTGIEATGPQGPQGETGPQGPRGYRGDAIINDFYSLTKLEDYLYEIYYDNIDYEFAESHLPTNNINGGCSSIRKDNLYGRNYDWYYDNYPTFIVHIPALNGKHASLSVGRGINDLTEEKANSREYTDTYKLVPFTIADGINDAGVVCNINVVPAGDWGETSGTEPAIELKQNLNTLTLLRFVLDNFDNATSAVNYLRDYCSIKMTTDNECHYMIADSIYTYVIEFLNNQIEIIDVSSTRPFMTNFYLKNAVFDTSTGLVDRTSLTAHGQGIERYELIAEDYDNITNETQMMNLMNNSLKYTKTYNTVTNPFWYTEFVGNYEKYGDITVTSPIEDFALIVEDGIEEFNNRDRNTAKTWQTVHSSVYNIEKKILYIIPQETGSQYTISLINCGNSSSEIDDSSTSTTSTWSSSKINNSKQNISDNTLTTTSKSIVGAINELDSGKSDISHTHTAAEVGLGNVGNFKAVSTEASQGLTNTEKENAKANIGVDEIEALIPSQATSSNQLADKNFVNSSIGTNTSYYISKNGQPFNSVAELEAYTGTVTNNDYAIITGTDEIGNAYFDRYKATVNGSLISWAKEYRINNSSFTAEQWAAITSGITSSDVALIDDIPNKQDTTDTDLSTSDKTIVGAINELERDKADKSSAILETVTAVGWSGTSAPYTNTISITGITSNNNVEVLPNITSLTVAQVDEIGKAKIAGGTQSTNSITLYAFGDKPTIDLPMIFLIRGD